MVTDVSVTVSLAVKDMRRIEPDTAYWLLNALVEVSEAPETVGAVLSARLHTQTQHHIDMQLNSQEEPNSPTVTDVESVVAVRVAPVLPARSRYPEMEMAASVSAPNTINAVYCADVSLTRVAVVPPIVTVGSTASASETLKFTVTICVALARFCGPNVLLEYMLMPVMLGAMVSDNKVPV